MENAAMGRTWHRIAPYMEAGSAHSGAWRGLLARAEALRLRQALRRADALRPIDLSGGVPVCLAFVATEVGERLVAVLPTEDGARILEARLRSEGVEGQYSWQELPLVGPSPTQSDCLDSKEVHIVGEGGVDNVRGDTGDDLVPAAVFTDLASANAYASALACYERAVTRAFREPYSPLDSRITLRTVAVGDLLPF